MIADSESVVGSGSAHVYETPRCADTNGSFRTYPLEIGQRRIGDARPGASSTRRVDFVDLRASKSGFRTPLKMMVDDPLLTDTTREAREDGVAERSVVVRETVLFDECRSGLTRLAFLLTGSRAVAEELVQDAFEQVVRRWSVIERPERYLRIAVVNGARSWGRRKSAPIADVPELIEIDEEAIAVRTELAALPHHQREVIVLRYFVGLSDSQVAQEVDRPLGTVKSNIRRGLLAMRKALR